jgi:hypothetical protein
MQAVQSGLTVAIGSEPLTRLGIVLASRCETDKGARPMTASRKNTPRSSDREAPAQRGEYGEGNYAATRRYNKATEHFVRAGRVDAAARQAKPRNPAEERALAAAEEAGRRRAKAEDPTVDRRPRASRAKR